MSVETSDVLVIGSGLAGCAAALAAARDGASVTLVTRADEARESNTWYAQGGIVARPPGDTPERLAADIARAGAGLCSPAAVGADRREGPHLVQELLVEELDVSVRPRTAPAFTGRSRPRTRCPASCTSRTRTGAAIERALIAACRKEKNVRWKLQSTAVDLLTLSHHSVDAADLYPPPAVMGAYLLSRGSDAVTSHLAKETILATGGLGRIYLHTTNPAGACGDGVAMAYRAGARCLNMQFVQFHPTTLYHPKGRLLLSEALRGEGARWWTLRQRVHGRLPPGRLARAARRRRARHPPDDARDGRAARPTSTSPTSRRSGSASASRSSSPGASRPAST